MVTKIREDIHNFMFILTSVNGTGDRLFSVHIFSKTITVPYRVYSTVPEIIDPVFAKTSQNARFLLSENERFGLVFVKTGSINSGTVQ
jgi:hypothetical protein